ncbi:hypothetical protein D0Z07_3658 [Hyphodiscus hymeniophilus]|uniref:Large ribosomal subunit protein mL50 n=1 Tax=Hyphodiscus hymeniophilus TaxID=353542 RepID=A0A9P7AXP8_9HELO|nr:hypothetical protein D0Z07_3658 [Hyphodiscus hymeniophilus]
MKVEETSTKNEEIDDDDTTHVGRATTWDGLKWVGTGPVWQPEVAFESFLPADAATHPEVIVASLHRAVVEVFALQQAGIPLHELSAHFPATNRFDWTDGVQITPSSSGATIKMPENTSLQEVMEIAASSEIVEEAAEAKPTESQEDVDADQFEVDPMKAAEKPIIEDDIEPIEAEEGTFVDHATGRTMLFKTFADVISSWDSSWRDISLENPEIKFAVVKRAMQLTGIRIPDAAIKPSNSVKALLNILVIPPKPKKLFEALEQKTDLSELGNVSVYPFRRGFASKEQDIGRLKVLKEALEREGLDLGVKEYE